MRIKWYGHSCFLLKMNSGVRIVTDPYDDTIGYEPHALTCDILTISHDHFDHNNLSMVKNEPVILRTEGRHEFSDISITGIKSYHDDERGAKRGHNLIFLFEAEGLRVAHMGDIGALPDDETLDILKPLDVLMVPIGGTYTIGPRLACDLANITNTRILIPMHYQTKPLKLDATLYPVTELISIAKGCSVHRLNQSECTILPESLGDDRMIILDYFRG